MSDGPELTHVEQPFLDQLASMGWKILTGSVDHPSVTGRDNFREVLIRDDLAKALRRINLRDGDPWLDAPRIAQAIGALERIGHARLIEAPDDELGDLGLLNDDEAILVMVDEAHRSHSSALHAALLQALPNCARIGFTGTPIIMGDKKRTHDIFGAFIDRYTLKESEADGATVPILYEGRYAKGAVADAAGLDDELAEMFPEMTAEEREALKRKHGTLYAILEAEEVIADKASDMFRHYVDSILPNGLKAQLVAISRRAAVRYQAAMTAARDALVAEADKLDPATRQLDDLELRGKPKKLQTAVRAARQLERLRSIEFAAIISPDNNDPPEWKEWTDPLKAETRIAAFKKPSEHKDPEKRAPLAFLIVKSMLLTGFDAPIEGVMYLDRPIREAQLLQAIARVNRTGHGKTAGIVVDYYGIAKHLKEALTAYTAEDIQGALQSLADEIPKLRDRHTRVVGLFAARKVDAVGNAESAVEALGDERLRAEFTVKLKQFLATLDLVLPRPEGLPFVRDAIQLGEIYARARNRYREGLPQLDKSVGRKVQALIDEHIISLGIDPRIPPIAITDAKFADQVGRQVSDRAKASEMEHAIRHHIKKKLDEDPVHYQKLSERLEEILSKFGDSWEQLALALNEFIEQVTTGRKVEEGVPGLDPRIHALRPLLLDPLLLRSLDLLDPAGQRVFQRRRAVPHERRRVVLVLQDQRERRHVPPTAELHLRRHLLLTSPTAPRRSRCAPRGS